MRSPQYHLIGYWSLTSHHIRTHRPPTVPTITTHQLPRHASPTSSFVNDALLTHHGHINLISYIKVEDVTASLLRQQGKLRPFGVDIILYQHVVSVKNVVVSSLHSGFVLHRAVNRPAGGALRHGAWKTTPLCAATLAFARAPVQLLSIQVNRCCPLPAAI